MDFLKGIDPVLLVAVGFGGFLFTLILAIGFLATRSNSTAESRLDVFTKRKGGSAQTGSNASIEIWREASFDADKKNLVDQILPKLLSLEQVFEQANVHIRPTALLMISVVLAVVGFFGSFAFGVPWTISLVPAVVLAAIPWWWLFQQREKRLKTFMEQMPDAMELLGRALRAGQSLQAGFHIISEEMPAPIATEFGRVYEEQNLGKSLDDSLKDMCKRVPNLDLNFFTTAVLIQRQTGGDMAEILDKISHVIRERFRIQGHVMALTGEGRLSGNVLIALPFFMLIVIIHLNYEYARALWETKMGQNMCFWAVVMQIVGAWMIRKIIQIKV